MGIIKNGDSVEITKERTPVKITLTKAQLEAHKAQLEAGLVEINAALDLLK
tara:strand:+ start:338 stop:490 length:153 start_codon:yes stop_codon:yes gene_type:complete